MRFLRAQCKEKCLRAEHFTRWFVQAYRWYRYESLFLDYEDVQQNSRQSRIVQYQSWNINGMVLTLFVC